MSRPLFNLDAVIKPLPTAGLTVLGPAAGRRQPQPRTEAQVEKARRRHARRVESRRFVALTQLQHAIELLTPLPVPGESLHGCTSGAFSGWRIGEAVLELLGQPVDASTVCTLGFNQANCDSLCGYLDSGAVRKLLLLVSDYFRSSDREAFATIRRELESRGQTVAIARSHAKLMLFQSGGRNVVVETSANLRSSMNWEQFVISDDAGLLQFHARWIHDLIEGAK